jgi:hypothetical protein
MVGGSLRVLWLLPPLKLVAMSWQSVLLMEETGVAGENHWHVASHWQTLSLYTPRKSTPAASTTKTGLHDIAEILLKVGLNTKNKKSGIIIEMAVLYLDICQCQLWTLPLAICGSQLRFLRWLWFLKIIYQYTCSIYFLSFDHVDLLCLYLRSSPKINNLAL